jgi:hypothetical protein
LDSAEEFVWGRRLPGEILARGHHPPIRAIRMEQHFGRTPSPFAFAKTDANRSLAVFQREWLVENQGTKVDLGEIFIG